MLKRLAPGDEATVKRIDRLARSTFDLFAIVKRIVDTGAHFRSHRIPSRSMTGCGIENDRLQLR
jgi:DNA invertase Pin-like site-specific DNA recombinase